MEFQARFPALGHSGSQDNRRPLDYRRPVYLVVLVLVLSQPPPQPLHSKHEVEQQVLEHAVDNFGCGFLQDIRR
ncbi:Protein of unknown function [Cotesia congregata]|uniref:Uncharacterized protein n=1 Tax=Cotesia congregata TaxID=51543 RepID=A0A8J2HLI6_COTCN|nr:Protein of unknown function [Cotesia congregata]